MRRLTWFPDSVPLHLCRYFANEKVIVSGENHMLSKCWFCCYSRSQPLPSGKVYFILKPVEISLLHSFKAFGIIMIVFSLNSDLVSWVRQQDSNPKCSLGIDMRIFFSPIDCFLPSVDKETDVNKYLYTVNVIRLATNTNLCYWSFIYIIRIQQKIIIKTARYSFIFLLRFLALQFC